jgi:hypothetical protein
MVTATSAWMASSPEAMVKLPPLMSIVPLEWMVSSAQSRVKMPPSTKTPPPALRPFELLDSFSVSTRASSPDELPAVAVVVVVLPPVRRSRPPPPGNAPMFAPKSF